MNEARLEELKRLLDERYRNLEQGSQENSDAQNFDVSKSVNSNLNASNFDASDLNSSNSKILNFNDKNSDGSNSNTKDNSKFQNLYSSQAASNKNSKTQARDYDKEPIVIKNPYEFFLANLFFFSHTGTFFILGIYAGYAGYVQFSEIKNVNIGFFGFLGFFLVFWALHIVATFYYYIIKNKCETKFTNKTIEFIIKGEVKRVKNLSDLIPFERTFNLRRYAPIATIFMHLIIIFPVIIAEITGTRIFLFFIAYHIICFCLNFLFKLIFHFILGGNLKEFSLFPAITIYHYEVLASAFSRAGSSKWNDIRGKFHMIYIIKHQDYLELQKYFSNKKHINLNSVKKSFLAI